MTITPVHLTVGQLFGHNFIFRVPKYQRYYAWTIEQIDDFLKDLDLCLRARSNPVTAGSNGAGASAPKARHHFFGGLVSVSVPVPGSARQNVEVIDGQQRLASFVILVNQLRHAMDALAGEVDPSLPGAPDKFLRGKAVTLGEKYERFKDTVGLQMVDIARLELSNPDKVFFAQLLERQNPVATRRSHQLLRAAYERVGRFLDGRVAAGTDTEKAQALALIDDVLEQDWTVIHMAASTHSEAYMLFQVLNDRGLGLTEGELLRAKTLEILDAGGTAAQMQTVEVAWDEILSVAPERVDDGLRWIYASRMGVRPGKTTLFDDCLKAFFPQHGSASVSQADAAALVKTVEGLRDEFSVIAQLLDGAWPYPPKPTPAVTAWDKDRLRLLVVELKHSNCLPLLLAAARELDEVAFSDVVQALERFVFRYKIVVDAHIGPATADYHRHAVEIRKSGKAYKQATLFANLRTLLDKRAPDATFRGRLSELFYNRSGSNKPIKYYLLTLEHYARWYDAGAQGRPQCKDKTRLFDFTIATIEHVHAQNAAQPDPALDPLVHHLGNLTILGPKDNDAAGSKPFAQKKPILAASTLRLNQLIAAHPHWGAPEVAAHEQRLQDMAAKVFVV